MKDLLKKMISTGIFASLLVTATVLHGAVFHEDFQKYDVENPSDFSTNGVPLGTWVPSSTADNAPVYMIQRATMVDPGFGSVM